MIRSAAAVAWVASVILTSVACEDAGQDRFRKAEQRYQRLISEGRLPKDRQFDEVLLLLDQVPSGSAVRPRAVELQNRLKQSRRGFIRAPLAAPAYCEDAARRLGLSPPEERDQVVKELEDCRERRAREEGAHPEAH